MCSQDNLWSWRRPTDSLLNQEIKILSPQETVQATWFPTCLCDQLHLTLCDPVGANPVHGQLLCPGDISGKRTAGGCCFLLQRLFPTQRADLCLWHLPPWQPGSLPLRHLGSPRLPIILEQTHAWHLFTSQEAAVWEVAPVPEGWLTGTVWSLQAPM